MWLPAIGERALHLVRIDRPNDQDARARQANCDSFVLHEVGVGALREIDIERPDVGGPRAQHHSRRFEHRYPLLGLALALDRRALAGPDERALVDQEHARASAPLLRSPSMDTVIALALFVPTSRAMRRQRGTSYTMSPTRLCKRARARRPESTADALGRDRDLGVALVTPAS